MLVRLGCRPHTDQQSSEHSHSDHALFFPPPSSLTVPRIMSLGSGLLPHTLEAKVVILGHTGVGKTSMLSQFVKGHFPTHTTATIGAAFMKKTIKLGPWSIILQIWDTAGQERFRSMSPMYFRGAAAAVLVYDVTLPATLDKVASWVEELQANTHSSASGASAASAAADGGGAESGECVFIVAGNKADLRPELNTGPTQQQPQSPPPPPPAAAAADSTVDPHAALRYASTLGAHTFLTSAKTGAGVDALFHDLAQTLLARHQRRLREATVYAEEPAAEKRRHADLSQAAPKQEGCCS